MKICIPTEDSAALDSRLCAHFGSAPYFLFVDTDDRSCESLANANVHHQHGACQPLAALAGRPVEALLVGGIGRGALMALASAGIPVYRATQATARDAVDAYARGALPRMTPAGACAGHGHHHG